MTRDEQYTRRLRILKLKASGKTAREIIDVTGYSYSHVRNVLSAAKKRYAERFAVSA